MAERNPGVTRGRGRPVKQKKAGALAVRRGGAPAIRRKLTPARATRARPTSPDSIKAVAMPASWTSPTPKIPAVAQLKHAGRFAPGGDLFAHRQKLKGLQRLQ